jgi:pimeloyl-ACP methyl ester carboxylesterase
MTADTIAFLEALDLGPAQLVGWSDGAAIGLLVGWRRPDLVDKLVYIGQNLTSDGLSPAFKAMLGGLSVEHLPPMLAESYAAVSPDGPAHFVDVFNRLQSIVDGRQSVAAVTARRRSRADAGDGRRRRHPHLVHIAELQAGLPNVQIAVIPGASHAAPMEKPDLVNRLILDFLAPVAADAPVVNAQAPVG